MAEPSNASHYKYMKKAYDKIGVYLPKGRRAELQTFADEHGTSINMLVNEFVRNLLGVSEEDWKRKAWENADPE